MQLKHFIIKEFRHILRDKRTLLVLLGMPMVQLLLFGYAISTDIQNAKVAIYDQDKSSASRELIHKFAASGYFEITSVLDDPSQIHELFKADKAKMVISLPAGMGKDMASGPGKVQLLCDASDPNTATILSQYAENIVNDYSREQRLQGPRGAMLLPEIKMHYNPEMKSTYLFVPGIVAVILMLISAMLTSIAITREKEVGTMEVILVSPLKPTTIIIGKVVAYFVISLVNLALILGIGFFVFHVPIRGSLLLLIMESMLYIGTALSLGVLISSVAESQQVALMMSLFALMMPTILLSGFIFPISSMPWPLQAISKIIPAQYFLRIIRGIMLKGSELPQLMNDTLVLGGMTLFYIAISVKMFKTRLG